MMTVKFGRINSGSRTLQLCNASAFDRPQAMGYPNPVSLPASLVVLHGNRQLVARADSRS
jgi:hypothetical protein